MTTQATLDGRPINTSQLSVADQMLIEQLHGTIGRDNSRLRCLGNGGSLYVRRYGGGWILAHFPGDSCGDIHRVALETDDHKRAKDYVVRAATDVGLDAEPEAVQTATRPDVLITGGTTDVGSEIQHSPITVRTAKTRTTHNHRIGITSVWYADAPDVPWVPHVPAVASTIHHPFALGMPAPASVAVAGVVKPRFEQCDWSNYRRFHKRGRPCKGVHPLRELASGYVLDDVMTGVALGSLVVVRGETGPQIVAARDGQRLEEIGWATEWQPRATVSPRISGMQKTLVCASPAHGRETVPNELPPATCSQCGAQIPPRHVLCDDCATRIREAAKAEYRTELPR